MTVIKNVKSVNRERRLPKIELEKNPHSCILIAVSDFERQFD